MVECGLGYTRSYKNNEENIKNKIGYSVFYLFVLGLRPVEFYGSFVMNNTTDVELAAIDSDKVSCC